MDHWKTTRSSTTARSFIASYDPSDLSAVERRRGRIAYFNWCSHIIFHYEYESLWTQMETYFSSRRHKNDISIMGSILGSRIYCKAARHTSNHEISVRLSFKLGMCIGPKASVHVRRGPIRDLPQHFELGNRKLKNCRSMILD